MREDRIFSPPGILHLLGNRKCYVENKSRRLGIGACEEWKRSRPTIIGVDPRGRQDSFTQVCPWLGLWCSPSPVTGLVYCIMFYNLRDRMEKQGLEAIQDQDWHICFGGSLSGRLGSGGRLGCCGWLQTQGWAGSQGWQCRCLCFSSLELASVSSIINNTNKGRRSWNKADQNSKPDTIPTHQVFLNKTSTLSFSVFSVQWGAINASLAGCYKYYLRHYLCGLWVMLLHHVVVDAVFEWDLILWNFLFWYFN